MSTHAKLSPSKRHRWMICPGSIREESRYPDHRGASAIDGTHTHTLLEHCLKNSVDPSSMVGKTMSDRDGEFTIDQDRANRVGDAVEYIYSRASVLNGVIVSESKVDPVRILGRDDMHGTVDVHILGRDTIEIIDYKDGMGVVKAQNNPQMELYAIGVLASLATKEYRNMIQTIRFTIIQPKLKLRGSDTISYCDVDLKEFYTFDLIQRLINEANATDDPNAPLVPGESQCKFCRAKGACSALSNHAMSQMGISTGSIEITDHITDRDPHKLSDKQIQEVLEAAPLIRQFIEGVEEEALNRMKSGGKIPGFKVVNGRGSRSWRYPDEEMVQKLIKMGVPKSSTHIAKLISPSQATELTWLKRDGKKCSLSKRQIEVLNGEYVIKGPGKLIVAPEYDDRSPVNFGAAELFTPIESQKKELPSWMK